MKHSIWIGYEPRESDGYAVTRHSIKRHLTRPIPVNGIVLQDMIDRGLFYREQEKRGNQLWDSISDAPCSTQFSISRFLVKELAGSGWAMFLDADMMARDNFVRVFDDLDESKALYCVKHDYDPSNTVKMDGQAQTRYSRKNWSSVFIINCNHPANKALTVDLINTAPGRDLHQFCWIEDDNLIGDLGEEWNWLQEHSNPDIDPKNVHFTTGVPSMPGYEELPYSDEWWENLYRWAR